MAAGIWWATAVSSGGLAYPPGGSLAQLCLGIATPTTNFFFVQAYNPPAQGDREGGKAEYCIEPDVRATGAPRLPIVIARGARPGVASGTVGVPAASRRGVPHQPRVTARGARPGVASSTVGAPAVSTRHTHGTPTRRTSQRPISGTATPVSVGSAVCMHPEGRCVAPSA